MKKFIIGITLLSLLFPLFSQEIASIAIVREGNIADDPILTALDEAIEMQSRNILPMSRTSYLLIRD